MSDAYIYKTSLEKKLDQFNRPFDFFIDTQRVAGIVLIYCIFLTVFLINLPVVSNYYKAIINLKFGISVSSVAKTFTLTDLVDDFLLIFFFLILGLEIKREFIVGELADIKRASLVAMGATGGVLFPILFYSLFNFSSNAFSHGWAIPVATDTAIAIGVMSLFKKRLPKGVFPFMAALAVLDDVVAISIIALFYTSGIQLTYILLALAVTTIMIIANIVGVRNALFYILSGLVLWCMFEFSGVHAAISGVIIAFTIPARPKDKPYIFVTKMKFLLKRFEKKHDASQHILESEEQHNILEQVTQESLNATTPLKRWEDKFEKPVLLIILPLFALTNGAFLIGYDAIVYALNTTLFWGILAGLLLGKPLGICLLTIVGLKLGIGKLPSDMKAKDIIPISLLAGIGYTMSIFVADLAFTNADYINFAKLSIVISSIVAAISASYIIHKRECNEPRE